MNRESAPRIPPYSIEAEQAVLGSMMLSQDARIAAKAIVEEQDFYRRDHQMLYRAITWLDEKKKPCDPVTIGDWIERNNLGEQCGDRNYLVDLAQMVPSVSGAKHYASIVLEKSQLRQLIEVGQQITNAGFEPEGASPIDLIGKAQTLVSALLRTAPNEVRTMSDLMQEVFLQMDKERDVGEHLDGLATGYPAWDDISGGLPPGVHYLGGQPKHGKSTVAQNIGEHCCLTLKKNVLAMIFEMTPNQYAKRIIASVGRVNAMAMRRGTLDDYDWANASDAIRKMRRGGQFFISRPKIRTPERVCAEIRKKHAETPLGLVILDYFQLLDFQQAKGENESSAMARGSKLLVDTAIDLGIPFLILSALNRQASSEKSQRPRPSHMRGSGGIEADAESVTFVYREELDDSSSRWKGTIEVLILLNRNGPTGECRLLHHGGMYRCDPLPFDWQPEAPAPKTEKARPNRFKAKPVGSKAKENDRES